MHWTFLNYDLGVPLERRVSMPKVCIQVLAPQLERERIQVSGDPPVVDA